MPQENHVNSDTMKDVFGFKIDLANKLGYDLRKTQTRTFPVIFLFLAHRHWSLLFDRKLMRALTPS